MPNKKQDVSISRSSAAEYSTFVAGSGHGGVEAVYADENVWLTQKMMGVLYDVNVRIVNEHLKKIFADSELQEEAVIRKFRITAADSKSYNTLHYKLPATIAVGYKVNSDLDVAEDMALRKIPMTMQDREARLNRFIEATDRAVLQDAGRITAETARAHTETEFEKYRIVQDRLFQSDFDCLLLELKNKEAGRGHKD